MLGFTNALKEDYLYIVKSYAKEYKFKIDNSDLEKLAIEWSVTRGSRSEELHGNLFKI